MTDLGFDRFSLIFIFALLGLAPFILMVVSSFLKIVVVLSLIRNALGVQQIPPNTIVNSMAIMLSIFIMTPIAQDTYALLKDKNLDYKQTENIVAGFEIGKKPIQDFLLKHSGKVERSFFLKTARLIWPEGRSEHLTEDSFLVLIPAFTISELTSAFKIGFLLYLPFIIIDLVVSNILLAMGMMMVSPMTISLPFKLLLFVLINGWSRLVHGLVLTYQ
ncbi:MAG: EscR/YscR/HrcR family type III secretion system export apparatus protein [Verrucomicrobia bacterium]|nr:MAG: EscR/YscR/HrcR family type III secretion system export apparatus protein [Verrucomicrobiota bacterium]